MKCIGCGFEAPIKEFRYLYNPRIDESMSLRQCMKCQAWLVVDQLKNEAIRTMQAGEDPWGKSTGIEGVAQ
ncbi:MAG: hypothetical protein JJV98_06450 [Desulfosarcina sp.]|nr:hypothetical protein [Desulfobacterales bacterium]